MADKSLFEVLITIAKWKVSRRYISPPTFYPEHLATLTFHFTSPIISYCHFAYTL